MRKKGIFYKELAVCVYTQIHVYGCRQIFSIRDWLTYLCRQASPMICVVS